MASPPFFAFVVFLWIFAIGTVTADQFVPSDRPPSTEITTAGKKIVPGESSNSDADRTPKSLSAAVEKPPLTVKDLSAIIEKQEALIKALQARIKELEQANTSSPSATPSKP